MYVYIDINIYIIYYCVISSGIQKLSCMRLLFSYKAGRFPHINLRTQTIANFRVCG